MCQSIRSFRNDIIYSHGEMYCAFYIPVIVIAHKSLYSDAEGITSLVELRLNKDNHRFKGSSYS